MSVNTGGFFFSNPAPLPANPQDPRDGEQQQQQQQQQQTNTSPLMAGCGAPNVNIINAGQGYGLGAGAGALGASMAQAGYNLTPNGPGIINNNQQVLMNNNGMFMNNNNVNNPMMVNNPINNNNPMMVNNPIVQNIGINNNLGNNSMNNLGNINPSPVNNTASTSTGFGSFFFNPLAQLFGTSQNNNTSNSNNNINALGNSSNVNVMASNNLINNNNALGNNSNPNMLNMVNNNNLLAMLQQQQNQQNVQVQAVQQQQVQQQNHLGIQAMQQAQQPHQQIQVVQQTQHHNLQQNIQTQPTTQGQLSAHEQIMATTMSPPVAISTNTQNQFVDTSFQLVNQQRTNGNKSSSPMPMAFLTPNQGPTPCPPTPPTPMFHDANSTIDTMADGNSVAGSSSFGGVMNDNNGHFGNNTVMVQGNDVAATITQEMQQELQQDTLAAAAAAAVAASSSKSWGITSLMGSALGAVATYVNQSFLSGIPFHIADRAMKESKATYAKWWEDGINNDGAEEDGEKKKKRKGSTDVEDSMDDSDDNNENDTNNMNPVTKKQKLDASGKGSELSVSLKKHYNDMGVNNECKFVEYRQAEQFQHNQTTSVNGGQGGNVASSSSSRSGSSNPIEVDSSIIKPRQRRSKFQKKRKAEAVPLLARSRGNKSAATASNKTIIGPGGRISGYNAFNNIGGMYDFGGDESDGGDNHDDGDGDEAEKKPSNTAPLTYDSLGSYYTTNEADGGENNNGDNDININAKPPPSTGARVVSLHGTKQSTGHTASATITSFSDHDSNLRTVDDDDASDELATTAPTQLDGTLRVISELLEEKNRASEENEMLQMLSNPRDWVKKSVRSELIDALQNVRGDVKDKRFLGSLDILSNFYKTSGRDARVSPWAGRRSVDDPCLDGGEYGYSGSEIGGPTSSDLLEGNWVNMSRPNYIECLGNNTENDFLYTLGRMSFDMFQPGNLICSVQNTHNTIKIIGEQEELPSFVPKSLREEVATLCDEGARKAKETGAKRPLLRSYDIAVSLTIEPPASVGQPNPPATPTPTKRMRAVMSVKGYVLPDPNTPNRLTVWFTGGKLSPARLAGEGDETDDEDQAENNPRSEKTMPTKMAAEAEGYGGFDDWTAMFAKGKWRKTLGERARAMAAKLLLGADVPNKMEEDGHMEYVLHRPVGGHGRVYVDVLYLDEDILIMRGHHGTIYAMARSGVSQRYRALRGGPKNDDIDE